MGRRRRLKPTAGQPQVTHSSSPLRGLPRCDGCGSRMAVELREDVAFDRLAVTLREGEGAVALLPYERSLSGERADVSQGERCRSLDGLRQSRDGDGGVKAHGKVDVILGSANCDHGAVQLVRVVDDQRVGLLAQGSDQNGTTRVRGPDEMNEDVSTGFHATLSDPAGARLRALVGFLRAPPTQEASPRRGLVSPFYRYCPAVGFSRRRSAEIAGAEIAGAERR